MRKTILILGLLIGVGGISQANPPHSPRRVHKVLVAALGKDGVRAVEIETGVKQRLGEHGTEAAILHTVLHPDVPVAQMLEQIETAGFDSVLCMAPRKTIQLAHSKASISSLRDCLTMFSTGKLPSGEPLEVDAFSDDFQSHSSETVAPLRSPMPVTGSAPTYRVSKGMLRLFAVPSGKVLWQSVVHVKMPAETQEPIDSKIVINAVWDALSKSGAFPK